MCMCVICVIYLHIDICRVSVRRPSSYNKTINITRRSCRVTFVVVVVLEKGSEFLMCCFNFIKIFGH